MKGDNRLLADDYPEVLAKLSAICIARVGNSDGEAYQRPVRFAIK